MKIIACMIAENEKDWIKLSLSSIIDIVDKVIIVDSGSSDNTKQIAKQLCKSHNKELIWIDHIRANLPSDDGLQRNVYVDYLKKHHLGDWAIVIDADEVWSGEIDKLRGLLERTSKNNIECFDLKTVHLIGDLGHCDDTRQVHWTKNRIFKVKSNIFYPKTEHGYIQGFDNSFGIEEITMYHFAHARHIFYWLDKHIQMKAKSEIHNEEAQKWWYYNHLLGQYPKKHLDPTALPKVIKDKFFVAGDIENWRYPKDYTTSDMAFDYIANWIKVNKIYPGQIIDIGCGGNYFIKKWLNIGFKVNGLDIRKVEGAVIKSNMEDLPLWDSTVDGIFCCHAFEHTTDPIKTIKEFCRVLKPRSVLYLITPIPCEKEIFTIDKTHKFVLNNEQLVSLLNQNGFQILDNKLFERNKEKPEDSSNLIIATNI